jgi:hypothetical protein
LKKGEGFEEERQVRSLSKKRRFFFERQGTGVFFLEPKVLTAYSYTKGGATLQSLIG